MAVQKKRRHVNLRTRMPTKMKMKVDKLVTGINVVLRWTCALWSSEIEMKGHFEVSLPHPGVIDFS